MYGVRVCSRPECTAITLAAGVLPDLGHGPLIGLSVVTLGLHVDDHLQRLKGRHDVRVALLVPLVLGRYVGSGPLSFEMRLDEPLELVGVQAVQHGFSNLGRAPFQKLLSYVDGALLFMADYRVFDALAQVGDVNIGLTNLQSTREGSIRVSVAGDGSDDGQNAAEEPQVDDLPVAVRFMDVAIRRDHRAFPRQLRRPSKSSRMSLAVSRSLSVTQ